MLISSNQLMVIAAFRHCLGSKTYMSGACVQWLLDNWAQLTEKCRSVIIRELEEAFRFDDLALSDLNNMDRVFDDVSRSTWMRLRVLYTPSYNIEELAEDITAENKPDPEDVDFGESVGKEIR